ncbi:hypothetical protein RRF57_006949 [Xylaria bambusicola]|uniref:N-acetyltransferase domain-containing protein n=1 Tax=Xylaria bambusicola TaxID=326684 RepID=A0AAN7YZD8_9PEZI
MGTPFITHLEPCRLDGYNPKLPHDQQPSRIPAAYRDAMSVREAVFVKEQGCPLENEHDSDDARSCHWVMYASVRTMTPELRDPQTDLVIQKRCSETRSMPIGTLRIVPFPHPPHPPDGARYVGGILQEDNSTDSNEAASSANGQSNEESKTSGNNLDGTAADPSQCHRAFSLADQRRLSDPFPFGADRQTEFHNGKEPYVKLGRIAVLPEFRGHQIAVQLWNAAKRWLQENPTYFNPSVKELGMDTMQVDQAGDIPKWNGLVCVHAQEAVTKVYERWGFKIDRGMGRFYEEGIPHIGMFQRLEVKSTVPTI